MCPTPRIVRGQTRDGAETINTAVSPLSTWATVREAQHTPWVGSLCAQES